MRMLTGVLVALWIGAAATTARAEDARPALAQRYVELAVGEGVEKTLREAVRIELAAATGYSDAERAWLGENAPRILAVHTQRMLERMTGVYAERFTEEELRALVAFHDSAIGRSIAVKESAIALDQRMEVLALQQAYTQELMGKFCAAFSCNGPTAKP